MNVHRKFPNCTKSFALVATLLFASATLAACGDSSSTGAVSGVFNGMGTHPGGDGRPSSGELVLTGSNGKEHNTFADSGGEFSIVLPPGEYSIIGWGPGQPRQGTSSCQGEVKVEGGTTSHVIVNCTFH
jgi:hypothetical protein